MKGGTDYARPPLNGKFDVNSGNCGYLKFMKWNDAFNPKMGFIRDDEIIVEAKITVDKVVDNGSAFRPSPEQRFQCAALVTTVIPTHNVTYCENFPYGDNRTLAAEIECSKNTDNVKYFGIRAYCNSENVSDDWACSATIIEEFNSRDNNRGLRKFIEWIKIVDSTKGYISNNQVVIEAQIAVRDAVGTSSKIVKTIFKLSPRHVDEGSITLKIPDFAALKDEVKSSVQDIGGVPWMLAANTECSADTDNIKHLSVYAYCNSDSESNIWSCNAVVQFQLIPQEKRRSDYSRRWDEIIKDLSGYICNDELVIGAHITVTDMVGVRAASSFNFSIFTSVFCDGVLTAGGKDFNISKGCLALHSPYFRALFSRKAGSISRRNIEDINADELTELLHVIYPSQKRIDGENYERLLKLAYKLEVAYVISQCEEFLMHTKGISQVKKLFYAEKYKLSKLQDECLKAIKDTSAIRDLKRDKDFGLLGDSSSCGRERKIALRYSANRRFKRYLKAVCCLLGLLVDMQVETVLSLKDQLLLFAKYCASRAERHLYVQSECSEDTDNVKCLGVYVCCNEESKSNLWSCNARIELRLVSQKEGVSDHTASFNCIFNLKESKWSCRKFVKWDVITDPVKGYILNNEATVKVKITVKESIGVYVAPTVDFFVSSPDVSDAVLIIGKKKVYVNKAYLSLFSNYFYTLFFAEIFGTDQLEIPFEDVNVDEFIELLRVIYPSRKAVDGGNYEFLLKLGYKFDVDYVVNSCERFLIASKDISVVKKLSYAERYKLSKLQEECLGTIKSASDVENLKNHVDFSLLGDASKSALFEKLFELSKEEFTVQEGSTTMRIRKFSSLLARRLSIYEIGGFSWKIEAKTDCSEASNNVKHFCLFVYCISDSSSNLWSCKAMIEFRLMSQKEGVPNYTKTSVHKFTQKEDNWGYLKFIGWDEIINPSRGYIRDNEVVVEAKITVLSSVGGRKLLAKTECSRFTDNKKYFCIYLHCDNKNCSKLWSCNATVQFRLISQKEGVPDYSKTFIREFNQRLNTQGYQKFMKWDEVTDPNNGYICDNEVRVRADILVADVIGRRVSPYSNREGFIKVKIPNFTSMNQQMTSSNANIGGFLWELAVTVECPDSDGSAKDINIYVYCSKESRSNLWGCEATVRFQVVSQNEATPDITRTLTHIFCFEKNSVNFAKLVDWNEVIDLNKGYICDDEVVILAYITIEKAFGVRGPHSFDFSIRQPEVCDVVLVVGWKKFYVSKAVVENYEPLLRLGHKFSMAYVINQCEEFLLLSKDVSATKKLVYAEKYKLSRLQDNCLKAIKSENDVKIMMEDKDFKLLGDASKSAMFNRVFESK
ncbi:unnamed protein product [Enterobius vermicularis]|uniref:BTB domain-containing protein n=1 Tax=Enterobius vermicularis TaxID=51028 RepID=A0A0N4UWK1_ENTVE|nr:unnamed protein product [Enterobius vermicularis]